jgi:preprotein translocase subunit YajC
LGLLILIVLMFVLMWVLVILPQRRRQAAQKSMIGALQPGQEVLTAGGLYGDVTEVGEDEVAIEISPGVVVRVATRAIAAVIPPDTYEDDEEAEEAEEEDTELVRADGIGDAEPDSARTSVEPDRR